MCLNDRGKACNIKVDVSEFGIPPPHPSLKVIPKT